MRTLPVVLLSLLFAIALCAPARAEYGRLIPPTSVHPESWVCDAVDLLADKGCIDARYRALFTFPCTIPGPDICALLSAASHSEAALADRQLMRIVLELALEYPELLSIQAVELAPRTAEQSLGDEYLLSKLTPLANDYWPYNALDYLQEQGYLQNYPAGYFNGSTLFNRIVFASLIGQVMAEAEAARQAQAAGEAVSVPLSEDIQIMLETLRAEFSDQC